MTSKGKVVMVVRNQFAPGMRVYNAAQMREELGWEVVGVAVALLGTPVFDPLRYAALLDLPGLGIVAWLLIEYITAHANNADLVRRKADAKERRQKSDRHVETETSPGKPGPGGGGAGRRAARRGVRAGGGGLGRG